ncbi:uncharacterized protein SCHCODRAFT_02482716 [Schizophyllum commune H4-8]|uniref:Expressed protein n=1 Tax=Schizophyllum commune (strain H4-8 / FGSC 9210) TaxID=578458 RepID=D8PX25_SCHCM|nr:uncharacterized protein SCHCODRAFT_02482716 [Schizophyllum commune H4-8]KAI5899716.1 hypothetical protein SCHCODRAFT_02482716 [Schizophyllum commune H4-8]
MFCVLYTTFERTKYTTFLSVQTVATFLVVIYHGDDTKEDPSLDTKDDPSHPHAGDAWAFPLTTAPSYDYTLAQANR